MTAASDSFEEQVDKSHCKPLVVARAGIGLHV